MGSVAVRQTRILVLNSGEAKTASLLSALEERGDVRVVDSCQEAIESIQAGLVDVVVSQAGDFLPGRCEQCAWCVRQALGITGEGVAAIDPDGRIVWRDAACQAIPEAAFGEVVSACLDIAGGWRRADRKNGLPTQTFRRLTLVDEAGNETHYDVDVSPVLDPDGRLTQVAAVIRDVTAIVRFERRREAVEQADRRVIRLDTGQFADEVSSGIAGPLNDILSDASALQSEYIGDETLRARLEAIIQNAGNIREAVKQMGRPSNGHHRVVNGHAPVDPMLAGKRLLVADDEDAIRETLYEVFRNEGCEVDVARDGAEAVGLLSRNRYDLVLADIRMPHKNGYEVFAAAKEVNADCAVILITGFGYDPNHAIIRADREGLAAVLFKPFKVDQLLDEARQALAQTVRR